jgi:hypothetical protein
MIKPTEEMIQAQAMAFSARMGELLAVGGAFDMADPKRAGLAAVLAIVERDRARCPRYPICPHCEAKLTPCPVCGRDLRCGDTACAEHMPDGTS